MTHKTRTRRWAGLVCSQAATLALLGGLATVGQAAPKPAAAQGPMEIKLLKDALEKANPSEQSAKRLALIDAYMAAGSPLDVAAECEQWLRGAAKDEQRQKVILTLIAAQRQGHDWDAAAGTSRTFVRDFPDSPQRQNVLQGLIEIARDGQLNLSSEAAAIKAYLEAYPDVADASFLMQRLARLQEITGDLSGAVATIQKFVQKYPRHEQADELGWRTVWLLHDRLRKTPEAVAAAQVHLRAYLKRPTLSADWALVGTLLVSIDKRAEAVAAYRQAMVADPQNRDAAAQALSNAVLASSADLKEIAALIQKQYANQPIAMDAELALLSRQATDKSMAPAAVLQQATRLLAHNRSVSEVCRLMESAATAAQADVIGIYRQQVAQLKGLARTEVALRLTLVLRAQKRAEEARQVLAAELRDNPANRRELSRDYLVATLEAQQAEVAAGKRGKIEIEPAFKALAELIKPHAYMPELRQGMEEAAGPLHHSNLRNTVISLRQELEKLTADPLAVAVDTVNREASRDANRVPVALETLLRGAKDKPYVFDIVGHSVWQAQQRMRENSMRPLPWLIAWAEARPADLTLQREVAEVCRRFDKNEDAVRLLTRVTSAPPAVETGQQLALALGTLLDLQAYTLKQPAAVDALLATLDKAAGAIPVSLLQERYCQAAKIMAVRKDGKDAQFAFYRKALGAGVTEQSIEAARILLAGLPADQAVALGKELLANPLNSRFLPEISLLVAGRMAQGQKDLVAAVALVRHAQQQRLVLVRVDGSEDFAPLRDLVRLARDVADAARVTDLARKALLAGIKPLSSEQMMDLMQTATRWLSGQALHEAMGDLVRLQGQSGQFGAQLDTFSRMLSRIRPNDPWHWNQNMTLVQRELGGNNIGVASTMLRLMLKHSPQMPDEARSAARNLLVRAYASFGEDLLAVDEKSPVAPLLKGLNYLKLGETKEAWASYIANADLFATKIDQVPVPYILFVGSELAHGSDADRDVAENLLRTWLARADKQVGLEPASKAAVNLKLADVFFYGKRYDVARAEYQSVIDKYSELPQAIDAQFRIGESLMYQKNYTEATKVFERLRKSKDAATSIRGTFMMGVLQYTSGAKDEARETFKALLDLSPTEELASRALFQLALIYGDDKRFKEMLDMLQAIGSFGEGKRWHLPGQMLAVMIHDPDLAIVQEASTVPVVVRTSTGDRETVNMVGGSAGRGIFMAEIPTALGAPRMGDGTLQLLGNDIISYDYPEEFKKKFKYIPPPQGNIRIAADAQFVASSAKIEDEKKTSVVENTRESRAIKRQALSVERSSGAFRPGNPLYVRVSDPDRSLTTGVDRVEVMLNAPSGDSVRVFISETGPDTGVFEGQVPTAERPPETVASDSVLGRPAAMAGDKDPATAWESQHDGQSGKWITADLKDVYPVKTFKFVVPNAKSNAPTKWSIDSSINGQMWERIYSTEGNVAHGLKLSYGPVRHWLYPWSRTKAAVGEAKPPQSLSDFIELLAGGKLPENQGQGLDSLVLPEIQPDAEADVHVLTGYFPSANASKYSFQLRLPTAEMAALVLDGQVVSSSLKDLKAGVTADVSIGWHRMALLAVTKGALGERKQVEDAKRRVVVEEGLGLAHGVAPALATTPTIYMQSLPVVTGRGMPAPAVYSVPAAPKVTPDGNGGAVLELADSAEAPGHPARMLRLNVLAYEGQYVSISSIEVKGKEQTYLPTDANLLTLAEDDVLQVSPGDRVTLTYTDQINMKTPGMPRVLSAGLQATYHNASVNVIAYEVKTGAGGRVDRTIKQVYRIDPGERIVAQIGDPDEDVSDKPDTVRFRVRTETGAELKDLEAVETGDTTGVFTKEIDTSDKAEPGKLLVKPGERIYVIYSDKLNTDPGSRVERVGEVQGVRPTDATAAILQSRAQYPEQATRQPAAPKPSGKGGSKVAVQEGKPVITYLAPEAGQPARVVLAAPLNVEVIDPDCAKDSQSTVSVEVTTTAGAKLTLPLELGGVAVTGRSAAAESSLPGRFSGQAMLILGRPNAEGKYSGTITAEQAAGMSGAWRYLGDASTGSVTAPILPISGADTITATYIDKRTTGGKENTLTSTARMVTDATLANLDRGYENPVSLLHLGERMFIRLEDGDRDTTPEQDVVHVDLSTKSGRTLKVRLTETLSHSGIFTGELMLQHAQATTAPATAPTTAPLAEATTAPTTRLSTPAQTLVAAFGDVITVQYVDAANTAGTQPITHEVVVNVAVGSDANMIAFTKQFGSEEVAVETQFKLAECWFELFKSHNTLGQTVEAKQALESGRSILSDLRDHHRGSSYEARVLYLLGSFHQELKEWDPALDCFRTIVRTFPNSPLAPDAQYKLGQCFEDKREMDLACEEYVRLAYTYPDNPLIAKCMVRLSDYFYKSGRFEVAANVCAQFLEQYPEHEWASKIAFRQGQCYFKLGDSLAASTAAGSAPKAVDSRKEPVTGAAGAYQRAGKAFDSLVERFSDSEMRPDALFWAGQSYHKAGDFAAAYRRYRRCTWDYPDTDAARYARGQLTLPEISQAEAADQQTGGTRSKR